MQRIEVIEVKPPQNLVDFTNVIASHEKVQNFRHDARTAAMMHLSYLTLHHLVGKLIVFDYPKTLNAFDAQLPTRSATQLSLINQLDDAMLLCAGSDGSVKLWRDYFRRGEETLVATWRTLKSRRAYKTYTTYKQKIELIGNMAIRAIIEAFKRMPLFFGNKPRDVFTQLETRFESYFERLGRVT